MREDVAVVRMLIETGAGVDVRNPGWLISQHSTGSESYSLFNFLGDVGGAVADMFVFQEPASNASMQILNSKAGPLFITQQ